MTDLAQIALTADLPPAKLEVLRALPRRKQLSADEARDDYTLRIRRVRKPKVSFRHMVGRAAVWISGTGLLLLRLGRERLSGKVEARRVGELLRMFFEHVGGTGIKIGQQLASRVDMLDFAICTELTALIDRVPPIEFNQAKSIIEESIGRPITEIFESIDTEPIGAASVACVYKGILRSGERVAIKVQRPGIAEQFAADVACIDVLTRVLEFLTFFRPDFFKHLRSEMEDLFYQELDFVQEGRYQSLFRRDCKRAGIKWLSAPKVYHELSSINVLVTGYVEGVLCMDLVKAAETDDTAMLEVYKRIDIDPKVVGRRILFQAWWRRYEEIFFHADPHPANILILPGNEIVMIDFGSCGVTGARGRRNELAYARYADQDNISALVEISIYNSMPLPPIDVEEFRNHLERYLWQNRLAQISKEAEWWERTTAGVFLGVAKANSDLKIPLMPNILEIMRATLLYDTIALRLYPGFNLNSLFRRYRRTAARRRGRMFRRRMNRETQFDRQARSLAEQARTRETLTWGRYWLESVTENMPVSFQLLSKKSAYVFSIVLRLLMNLGIILGVAAGAAWIVTSTDGGTGDPGNLLIRTLKHPAFLVIAGLLTFQALRRIAFRMRDPDPNK